jgi:hypothetical protein
VQLIIARTGIHGGHQHEAGGEAERHGGAGDGHDVVFERLAQHGQHVAGELRELVQEQDAIVRDADFAGTRHAHAAANQAGAGNGVVRRAKRALMQEAGGTAQQAGNAVNLGGLNGFFEGERRQDAGEAFRQHGLARTGRADHQDVMRAGGGHFEGALGHGLAAYIAEIGTGLRFVNGGLAVRALWGEFGWTFEERHYFGETADTENVHAFHHGGFGGIFGGHDQVADSLVARADGNRERTADRADGAIERQFPDHQMAVESGDLPHGAQDAEGHGQVKTGAFLADIGGRQVDGELAVRVAVTGIIKSALDPLAAFAHGGIGHADHHTILRAARLEQVDLDIDQVSINAIDGSAARFKQRHSGRVYKLSISHCTLKWGQADTDNINGKPPYRKYPAFLPVLTKAAIPSLRSALTLTPL